MMKAGMNQVEPSAKTTRSPGKDRLKNRLKAGYQADAEENLKLAAEWFPLEEEAWHVDAAWSAQDQSGLGGFVT